MQTRSRSTSLLATETIPYSLWVLSAGEGSSGALDRAATSLQILNKAELGSFHRHVMSLRCLGLSYVAEQEEAAPGEFKGITGSVLRLEPPIDRLAHFMDLTRAKSQKRIEIPIAVRCVVGAGTVCGGVSCIGSLTHPFARPRCLDYL
jgi:chromosome transmission fidelity protein 18